VVGVGGMREGEARGRVSGLKSMVTAPARVCEVMPIVPMLPIS
jgi:hypothetical protein